MAWAKTRPVMAGTSFLSFHIIGMKVRMLFSRSWSCTFSSLAYVARSTCHCGRTPAEVSGRPFEVFRVSPIGLVLSSNNSFWFCFFI